MNPLVEDMLLARQYAEHELELYVQEEMEKLPPCEGFFHSAGSFGHKPTQHAEFLVIYPCDYNVSACRGWVEDCAGYDFADCFGCNGTHLMAELVFIPLDFSR